MVLSRIAWWMVSYWFSASVMIPDDEAMSGMRVMLVLNRIDEWWCLWQIDDGHMAS
jgi:hypothetical protein